MSRRAVFYRVLTIGFLVYALAMLGIHLASFWSPIASAVAEYGAWLAALLPALTLGTGIVRGLRRREVPKVLLQGSAQGFGWWWLSMFSMPTCLILIVGLGYGMWWYYLGFGPASGVPAGKIYQIRAVSALNLLGSYIWLSSLRDHYMEAQAPRVVRSPEG
jgi:hypothetical protein